DFRTRPTRYLRRAIVAAAVDHNDAVDHGARQRRNDRADRFGFKECRNDHSNPLRPRSRWSGAWVGRLGCVIVAQYGSTTRRLAQKPRLGSSARLQAPTQATVGACGRRVLRQERLAEIAIGLAGPDFP